MRDLTGAPAFVDLITGEKEDEVLFEKILDADEKDYIIAGSCEGRDPDL